MLTISEVRIARLGAELDQVRAEFEHYKAFCADVREALLELDVDAGDLLPESPRQYGALKAFMMSEDEAFEVMAGYSCELSQGETKDAL